MKKPKKTKRRIKSFLLIGGLLSLLAGGAAELQHRERLRARTQAKMSGFDLYSIGGSTMDGQPYQVICHFDPATLAALMLGRQVQGKPMVVHKLAELGNSIYPQAVRFDQLTRFRDPSVPGAVLIYSGHNENFTHQERAGAVRRSLRRVKQALMHHVTLLGHQWLQLERRFDLRGRRDLDHQEAYLRQVLEQALDRGLVPILSTLSYNQADVAPDAGLNPDAVRQRLKGALAAEQSGRLAEAQAAYIEASKTYSDISDLAHFRAGQCARSRGHYSQARRLLRAAAEAPTRHFCRVNTAQNEMIRRLAREYGVPLVDAAKLFEAASPQGIPDRTLFADGLHPNIQGYWILARGFAEALASRFSTPLELPPGGHQAILPRRFGCGPKKLAQIHLRSSSWLTSTSIGHPAPDPMLEFARWHVEQARPELAQDYSLLIWEALLPVLQRRPALLSQEQEVGWLQETGLTYEQWTWLTNMDYCTLVGRAASIARHLKTLGARRADLQRLKAAARLEQGRCDSRPKPEAH